MQPVLPLRQVYYKYGIPKSPMWFHSTFLWSLFFQLLFLASRLMADKFGAINSVKALMSRSSKGMPSFSRYATSAVWEAPKPVSSRATSFGSRVTKLLPCQFAFATLIFEVKKHATFGSTALLPPPSVSKLQTTYSPKELDLCFCDKVVQQWTSASASSICHSNSVWHLLMSKHCPMALASFSLKARNRCFGFTVFQFQLLDIYYAKIRWCWMVTINHVAPTLLWFIRHLRMFALDLMPYLSEKTQAREHVDVSSLTACTASSHSALYFPGKLTMQVLRSMVDLARKCDTVRSQTKARNFCKPSELFQVKVLWANHSTQQERVQNLKANVSGHRQIHPFKVVIEIWKTFGFNEIWQYFWFQCFSKGSNRWGPALPPPVWHWLQNRQLSKPLQHRFVYMPGLWLCSWL